MGGTSNGQGILSGLQQMQPDQLIGQLRNSPFGPMGSLPMLLMQSMMQSLQPQAAQPQPTQPATGQVSGMLQNTPPAAPPIAPTSGQFGTPVPPGPAQPASPAPAAPPVSGQATGQQPPQQTANPMFGQAWSRLWY